MNTFTYKFYIENKPYTVFIDSSKDEWKRIIINNKEVVNEKYTLALNRKAYIIYYPINISDNELVISIDDSPLKHSYNVYLNNVSLLDETNLDDEYLSAISTVEKGFSSFLKNNWFKILIENLFSILATLAGFSLFFWLTLDEFIIRFLLAFIIVPLALPIFIAGEWFHMKNIIKKYKNCFRPTVFYKTTDTMF